MITKTLGRRYAKALLALALERSEPLQELLRELEDFESSLTTDHRLVHLLSNPNVPMGDRFTILDKVLKLCESRPLIINFMHLLLRRGRLLCFGDVVKDFRRLVDDQAGLIRATVTTASDINEEELEKIRTLLQHRFGKKILITVSVDPELIGGLVIRVGSLSFDGSIRSQLKEIQSQLLEEVTFS